MMIRTAKSIFLVIGFLVILSFLLPGCYTQLSRPRVDTDDKYSDTTAAEDVEEYYQDEGAPSADDSRDVYIYNYYPYSWNDYYYYDYWSGYYNPYRWRYIGPYPDFWWDPYGRWWTPGWYVGFYYYDNYWGGYPRYYDSYYRYGYGSSYSERTLTRRPFDRRSIGVMDRARRQDTQSTLAKPISPNRVERPTTTLSTPIERDKSLSPDRKPRTVKEMVNERQQTRIKTPQTTDDGKATTVTRERPAAGKPRTIKNPPRSSETTKKPNMIEQAPSRNKPATPGKSYSKPIRSSNRDSNSISRPGNSNNSGSSKPASPSYTPRSSSGNETRSTPPPSSSSSSNKSSNSSKSSGSSRTKK